MAWRCADWLFKKHCSSPCLPSLCQALFSSHCSASVSEDRRVRYRMERIPEGGVVPHQCFHVHVSLLSVHPNPHPPSPTTSHIHPDRCWWGWRKPHWCGELTPQPSPLSPRGLLFGEWLQTMDRWTLLTGPCFFSLFIGLLWFSTFLKLLNQVKALSLYSPLCLLSLLSGSSHSYICIKWKQQFG